jgi:hypothetical protein
MRFGAETGNVTANAPNGPIQLEKRVFFLGKSPKVALYLAKRGRIGSRAAAPPEGAPIILRQPMNDEPKSAAELKEIRVNRKIAQEAEGIKAMADIAAADIAIRKRTADLRAARLAREAAERDNPVEPKVKTRAKKKKAI